MQEDHVKLLLAEIGRINAALERLAGPAPAVMTGIVVDGRYGHASPTLEAPLWTPHVRAFMTAGATSSPHPRPPAP